MCYIFLQKIQTSLTIELIFLTNFCGVQSKLVPISSNLTNNLECIVLSYGILNHAMFFLSPMDLQTEVKHLHSGTRPCLKWFAI